MSTFYRVARYFCISFKVNREAIFHIFLSQLFLFLSILIFIKFRIKIFDLSEEATSSMGVHPRPASGGIENFTTAGQSESERLRHQITDLASNNFIILTICNKGMAMQWLQQWYVSARKVGINNIVVIATDLEAYNWIRARVGNRVIDASRLVSFVERSDVHRLGGSKIAGVSNHSKAFDWRSSGYENIVVQRATILKAILQKTDTNVLYSDTDVHWIKNPEQVLRTKYSKYDMCLQREKGDELGDYNCSGVILLMNSILTQEFLSIWEHYIRKRALRKGFFTDQEEVNHLLLDIKNGRNTKVIGTLFSNSFRACTLDWDEFPSGINYFSQRKKGRGKISKTCTSKICKNTIWVPQLHKMRRMKRTEAFLVHHNYAKSNLIKVERAKRNGLWLNLGPQDWFDDDSK